MDKIKLGIVFGGQSSEYSVSLHSSSALIRAINQDKYELVLIGITKDGIVRLFEGSIDDIEHDNWLPSSFEAAFIHKGIINLETNKRHKLDVVFPVVHGKNGEDGTLQGLFEVMNIPYVGDNTLSSAICMDKEMTHIVLEKANIPMAKYVALYKEHNDLDFKEVEKIIPLPWIIKPCNAGSSYGVNIVKCEKDFIKAKEEAYRYDGRGKLIVEEFVDGFEIGCAVLGHDQKMVLGSVDEIAIAKGSFFDFDGKYALKGAKIYCPARISKECFKKARSIAKSASIALNCEGMARVDMFVLKNEEVIVNEVNTIPGFTDTSRYPSMMNEVGIPFSELIDKLIALALDKEVGVC